MPQEQVLTRDQAEAALEALEEESRQLAEQYKKDKDDGHINTMVQQMERLEVMARIVEGTQEFKKKHGLENP